MQSTTFENELIMKILKQDIIESIKMNMISFVEAENENQSKYQEIN